MPKTYCYLNQKIIDQLTVIKENEKYESSSLVMKEMIKLGITTYLNNKNQLKQQSINDKINGQHTRYLLRLLAISSDILQCVYNSHKLAESNEIIEEHINQLKEKVEDFIKNSFNN